MKTKTTFYQKAVENGFFSATQIIGENAKADAKAKYPDMDFGKVTIGGKTALVWTTDEQTAVTVRLRY